MAPTRPGGRPKIPWTSSRKRKLVRLYLMTNLKINEIQQVLETNGFTPGTRNIQTQLSVLLPDNANEWRQYRPSGMEQGKHRLAQFKCCKKIQFSNYARQHPRYKTDANISRHLVHGVSESSSLHISSPYYDPSRHYEEILPGMAPSHFSMPQLTAWYENRFSTPQVEQAHEQDADGTLPSDKEVVSGWADSHVDVSSTDQIANLNSTCSAKASASQLQEEDSSSTSPGKTNGPRFAMGGMKRSNSRASSIGGSSIRTMGSRISSKLSISLSHVQSVLSATNSWRSSLVYAMSISSGKLSNTSEVSWSKEEFDSWNELVDESKLVSGSVHLADFKAKSLHDRPCCAFFEKDLEKRTMCTVCGFSESHQLARFSMSDDLGPIDPAVKDRFGNSPLHHAASAGNTARVVQLLTAVTRALPTDVNAQNTSGETFLHVFRIKAPEEFPEYLDILRDASSQGFRFTARDYYGRCVAERLHELMDDWNVDPSQLREAGNILGIEDVTNSNTGHIAISANVSEVLGSPGLTLSTYANVWELPGSPEAASGDKKPKEGKKQGSGLSLLKDILGYSRLRRLKSEELFQGLPDDLDSKGDTFLISTLKNWSQNPKSRAELQDIIRNSNIHIRDERGYTALAIAARFGLTETVSILLQHGANPNTRSYQKTSVMGHAATHLVLAQKKGNDALYSRILSCITLLSDHGAKVAVTVYDEYTVSTSITKPVIKVKIKPPRITLRRRSSNKPLDVIEEDVERKDNYGPLDVIEGGVELAATSVQPLKKVPIMPYSDKILAYSSSDSRFGASTSSITQEQMDGFQNLLHSNSLAGVHMLEGQHCVHPNLLCPGVQMRHELPADSILTSSASTAPDIISISLPSASAQHQAQQIPAQRLANTTSARKRRKIGTTLCRATCYSSNSCPHSGISWLPSNSQVFPINGLWHANGDKQEPNETCHCGHCRSPASNPPKSETCGRLQPRGKKRRRVSDAADSGNFDVFSGSRQTNPSERLTIDRQGSSSYIPNWGSPLTESGRKSNLTDNPYGTESFWSHSAELQRSAQRSSFGGESSIDPGEIPTSGVNYQSMTLEADPIRETQRYPTLHMQEYSGFPDSTMNLLLHNPWSEASSRSSVELSSSPVGLMTTTAQERATEENLEFSRSSIQVPMDVNLWPSTGTPSTPLRDIPSSKPPNSIPGHLCSWQSVSMANISHQERGVPSGYLWPPRSPSSTRDVNALPTAADSLLMVDGPFPVANAADFHNNTSEDVLKKLHASRPAPIDASSWTIVSNSLPSQRESRSPAAGAHSTGSDLLGDNSWPTLARISPMEPIAWSEFSNRNVIPSEVICNNSGQVAADMGKDRWGEEFAVR